MTDNTRNATSTEGGMVADGRLTTVQHQPQSLVARIANKYAVEPAKMLATLKATCFRSPKEVTNEQMMSLLIVADQYGLNPFTREMFAFPDEKTGGIVPVLSIDGWVRIIRANPKVEDGPLFTYSDETVNVNGKDVPTWCECTIKCSDRAHATVIREWFDEVKRNTGPWGSHPRRMLRHKAMIQCARVALGYSGIYDQDEAERIIEAAPIQQAHETPPSIERLNASLKPAAPPVAQAAPAAEAVTPEREPGEDDE